MEENRKCKVRVEELIISQEKYQREVAKWENQNKTLLVEIQRLKDITESSFKKYMPEHLGTKNMNPNCKASKSR